MKKIFISALALTLTLGLAAQSYTPAVKLEAGKQYTVTTITKSNMTQEAMGQTMEIPIDATNKATLTIKELSNKGYESTYITDRVQFAANMMGQDMNYDSDKKDDKDSPMGKTMNKLVGKETSFVVNGAGNIIKETIVNLENPILISACDNGVFYDRKKYLELLNDESIDVIVWTFRNNQASKTNPNAYAWLDVDENNNIKYVSCKKFIYKNPLTTHAIIGTMFFRKGRYFMEGLQKNYNENIRTNGEFYVDDVLNQNIKDGLKVKVFEVENYICWGTPNDYKTYNYWNKYFNKINIHKKNDYF